MFGVPGKMSSVAMYLASEDWWSYDVMFLLEKAHDLRRTIGATNIEDYGGMYERREEVKRGTTGNTAGRD
jgi:hypothetical protein